VADSIEIAFQAPSGEPVRFEWDEGALEAIEPDPERDPVWRLGGELDWDEIALVRVLSARLGDGRLLAVAALRPAGAEGHGDEVISGALGEPGAAGALEEVLLSTEYGPDELPRRVGLEVHEAGAEISTRLAAGVDSTARSNSGAVERLAAALSFRGVGGAGVLDLLRRA
jgi:hypothetical protein